MILPQTGRQPLPLSDADRRRLLGKPHPLDERDPFATDPNADIRALGRIALRRTDANDSFALGDLCARAAFTADQRLLIFYVGKALIAYRRAGEQARHDVDRVVARRAVAAFIEWVSQTARQHPTRRNIAVALWAIADQDEARQTDPLDSESGEDVTRYTALTSQEEAISNPAVGILMAAYLRPHAAAPDHTVDDVSSSDGLSDNALSNETSLNYPTALKIDVDAFGIIVGDPDHSLILADEALDDPSAAESQSITLADSPADEANLALSLVSDANALHADIDSHASDTFVSETRIEFAADADAAAASLEMDRGEGRPRYSLSRRRDVGREDTEFAIGDVMDNRYEVADVRRGGMGVVYLCYDRELHEPVAIKSFQGKFLDNERAVARFLHEAVTWIHLEKHRHIVQARLVQNMSGRPHIILEHISGPEGLDADLRSWIDRKRLTLRHAAEFGVHIALGMQHATQKVPGLVHRDLKPANILVTHDGIAKVTDFGLVRSLDASAALSLSPVSLLNLELESALVPPDERLTRVGAVIGTAPYMSPEQCQAQNVDQRSDIYAFGCLLYEMLTGKPVFPVKKLEAWLHAHVYDTPIFDAAASAAIPVRLQILVMRCLEKQPSHRPSEWGMIADELAAICEDITGSPMPMVITGQALQARELMDKGYSLTELGRLDEALEAYDRAIAMQPDYAWAWARKGRTLRLLSRYHDALVCYDEALRIEPGYAWAWKGKGIVYERLNVPDQALACYQKASEIDPDDVWNWYNQADALHNVGRSTDSVTMLKRALQIDEAHPNSWAKLGQVYRQQGDLPAAAAAYERAISLDPTYAWALNGYGLALKTMGQLKEASLTFKRAARYQPEVVWHWYNLTEVLVDLRMYGEAVQSASEAVRVQPDHALSWAKLGQVLRYESRFDEALHAYDRAIALQPDYAWAINGKGIVLEKLARYEEALTYYRRASAVSGDGIADVWHWYNQGNLLAEQNRLDEALVPLEQAVRLNPTHARSWARLGNVRRQRGQLDAALSAFQHAVERDPAYAWAWHELGLTYAALDQPDNVLVAYQHAVESSPADGYYRHQLIDVNVERGDFTSALHLLDQALQRDPHNADHWAKQGQVQRRMGQPQAGLRSYRRALELAPDDAWMWHGYGVVYVALVQYEEAAECFTSAVQIDPAHARFWYDLGDAWVALKRPSDALPALDQALTRDANDADTWAKRGQALRLLSREREALAAYDRALALRPAFAWAWSGRGLALETLDRREEAVASYERAIHHDPAVLWYRTNLADVLLDLERKRDALTVIDAAAVAHPTAPTVWARRGQIQRRIGDFSGAVESYQRALDLDPVYAWAWNGQGLAYKGLRRWHEALTCYQEAVRLHADDVWYWYNHGEILLVLNDCEGAVDSFTRALQIDPAHAKSIAKRAQATSCVEADGLQPPGSR